MNGTSYSKRWRHLAAGRAADVLAQVAEALDYAHHQGVVHRDVKPANVLVTSSDVPKLSDFGLSMLAAEQGDKSGVVRGTPHYMSPEQTRGGRLDYRTDLYSLGVMIYESATGSVPFTGTSVSIMTQHYSAVPDPPRARNPAISEELEALILSLLAKRPADRPGSGSDCGPGTASGGRANQRAARPGADRARERDGNNRFDGSLPDRAAAWAGSSGSERAGNASSFAIDRRPNASWWYPRCGRHRCGPAGPLDGHRPFCWRPTGTASKLTPASGRGHRRRHWWHAGPGPLAAGPADARAWSWPSRFS